MSRSSLVVLLIAIAAGLYQFVYKPALTSLGKDRIIEALQNDRCTSVPELQACEKIVLHQPSGLLYLACSTPSARVDWLPTMGRFNATGKPHTDYVAVYDPATSEITRLTLAGFTEPRGLSLHGMDVVPSASDPSLLFVYLVNHREPQEGGQPAHKAGADSVIEVFKTRVGHPRLTHVRTVEDPVIVTPNDIVGSSDGNSFHFTNDRSEKTGFLRELELVGRASSSVGHCHVDTGCKFAITGMNANNGIARAVNDTFYVASSLYGKFTVLERQLDNTLVITDVVRADRGIDSLSVDDDGAVWGAGFPDALKFALEHIPDPTVRTPSSALRLTRNISPESFYGEKYKIDKVFEDNGTIASGITTVAYDARRGLLFLHGCSSPQLVVCQI